VRENRLYFIAAPGRIKIGITVDVKRRLSEIGKHLAEEIELLGHVAGSYGFEKHLHSLLAEHAIGREWFKDCDDVRNVMTQVLSGDVVGFVPKQNSATEFVEVELTFERWLGRFNAFAKMVFPDSTTEQLSDFLECTPEQTRRYLLGDDELPDLLWKAFSAHVVGWVLAKYVEEKSMRNVRVTARK
jgi:hypothetical protein